MFVKIQESLTIFKLIISADLAGRDMKLSLIKFNYEYFSFIKCKVKFTQILKI